MQENPHILIEREARRLDVEAADRARNWADTGIMLLPAVQWIALTSLSGKWAVASGLAAGAATLVCARLHNHFLKKSEEASDASCVPSARSCERAAFEHKVVLG